MHAFSEAHSAWRGRYIDSESQVSKHFNEADYGSTTERLHKIRIEARVNDIAVEDTIVWDLKSNATDPDAYAAFFCRDLQLPADLIPIISQSIRDQVCAPHDACFCRLIRSCFTAQCVASAVASS